MNLPPPPRVPGGMTPLKHYSADHRYLLDAVGRAAGLERPVAIDLDDFEHPLLRQAKRRELVPLDGVLVRDWDPDNRRTNPGVRLGARVYEIDGVRFAQVRFGHDNEASCAGLEFTAVAAADYARLYKLAVRCRRDDQPPSPPPVLPPEQLDALWRNTIGYLDSKNLERIKAYGGRARRGVLLTGAPGNGKTMACRWVWEACRQRRWEYKLVTPDAYRTARKNETVEQLFAVEKRGVIFFDDMDLALRDRDRIAETEDQAVFLSAMDGLTVNEGVVFVFTTNCGLDLIDRAFKRPGRLDLIIHFKAPDAGLRRQLIDRWHADIRAGINIEQAVAATDGYSFAEIEELKNLLVMRYMEAGAWDWAWAMRQFAVNRAELNGPARRAVSFGEYARRNGEEVGR